MDRLSEIKEHLDKCDDKMIKVIEERMQIIETLIQYKSKNRIPVLEPEYEKEQKEILSKKISNHRYKDEISEIFESIFQNSRKVQAKILFPYNIVLIGFMGSGKSTIASCLTEMLAMEEIETDTVIEQDKGMKIAEIFEQYGEKYFRNCETEMLKGLEEKDNIVISCGGGMVLRRENVDLLKKKGKIVLLSASPETVLDRVKHSKARPILNNHMNTRYISDLMSKRQPIYEKVADIIIHTDNKSVLQISEEIILGLMKNEL